MKKVGAGLFGPNAAEIAQRREEALRISGKLDKAFVPLEQIGIDPQSVDTLVGAATAPEPPNLSSSQKSEYIKRLQGAFQQGLTDMANKSQIRGALSQGQYPLRGYPSQGSSIIVQQPPPYGPYGHGGVRRRSRKSKKSKKSRKHRNKKTRRN